MKRPRIAVLFPVTGLIDGDICAYAESLGAEALIFRVSAESGAENPEHLLGTPERVASAVQSMGSLDSLKRVASAARAVNPDAVAWTCTSGSFLGDASVLTRQLEVLEEAARAPATTTSLAILEALGKRGIKRVCVVTPYSEAIGKPFVDFLHRNGIEVLGQAHAGCNSEEAVSALTVEDLIPLSRQAWNKDAQGWVVPCTAVRVGGIVQGFEVEYGLPTILAYPATLERAVEIAMARRVKER